MAPDDDTYCWGTAIEVVEVLVERVAVELDGDDLLGGRVCNTQCLLETFEYTLAILVGVLKKS